MLREMGIIGPYKEAGWFLQYWPVLALSFVAAFAATWVCKKVALKFGIVDRPDNIVKTHKEPIAYLGGVGIFAGLTVGVMAGIYCLQSQEFFAGALKLLLGILAGASIACFIGVIDDLFDITPLQKLLGQLLATVMLILVGIRPMFGSFIRPLGWTMPAEFELMIGIPIAVVFVLGATNSLNLLDGLDGLCAGVTVIITIAMLLLSIHLATWNINDTADATRLIICLGLLGAVLGFLPFNRHPAKIFMGDAGSMLLGFSVAALMILFAERSPRWWMASILVFGLPILDTAVALVRRVLNRRPLFVSDRGHIYDQMIDRGLSLKKTVRICYFLSGLYAMLGMIISQLRTRYAAVIFLIVIIISAVVVWEEGFLKMEGLRGMVKKK